MTIIIIRYHCHPKETGLADLPIRFRTTTTCVSARFSSNENFLLVLSPRRNVCDTSLHLFVHTRTYTLRNSCRCVSTGVKVTKLRLGVGRYVPRQLDFITGKYCRRHRCLPSVGTQTEMTRCQSGGEIHTHTREYLYEIHTHT